MNVTIIGAGNMGRGIAFSGTLVEGQVAGQPLDVFIAGDDEEAKETVAQLVREGGCGPSTSVLWSVRGSWRGSGSWGSCCSSRWG